MTSDATPEDLAGTVAVALAATGGLLVGWHLLATVARPAYPRCHLVAAIPRGPETVPVHHLPLLVGAGTVLAGAGPATEATRRRRLRTRFDGLAWEALKPAIPNTRPR